VDDFCVYCQQCGKTIHAFKQDTVGKFIDYFRQSQTFANTFYATSHISNGHDAQILLIILELRWNRNWKWTLAKFLVWLCRISTSCLHLNICQRVSGACQNNSNSYEGRGIITTTSTLPTIWIMWALFPNPSTMGQTISLVKNEPNFPPGMRG